MTCASSWRGAVLAGLLSALPVPAALGVSETMAGEQSAIWQSIFARPTLVMPEGAVAMARVALGAALLSDRRLSGDGTRSCASCHVPRLGFVDGLARARARDGGELQRNTPTLFNLATARRLFWDGRVETLEAQALAVITHPDEMAGDIAAVAQALAADPEMVRQFAAAFPETPAPSGETIAAALATYERTLLSPQTRFDRWIAGEADALDARERAGFDLFVGTAGCLSCHGGWRFTDDRLHDIGRAPAPGRLQTVKTPQLRELGRTGPYLHDGSAATLAEVVRHYSDGIVQRQSLAQALRQDRRLDAREQSALVAFLATLTSPGAKP